MKILVMLLSLLVAGGSVSEVSLQRFMTAYTTTETAVAIVEPSAPPIGYQSHRATTAVVESEFDAVAEAWINALDAGWMESEPLYYLLVADDPEMSYPTLALAEIGDAIELELYMARASGDYWLIVGQMADGADDDALYGQAIAHSVNAYDSALLDVATTAKMLETLQETMDTLRTAGESNGDSFYAGDLYISVDYDAETGLFNSFIALP